MSGIQTYAMAVETDAAVRQLLANALAKAGFDVEATPSVEEALQAIHRKLPEVILIDWLLPGKSALQFAQSLRSIQQRTIDVSVRRLRIALGNRGRTLVQSVRGVGYRFNCV
ncbi:MAG: response regulator [Betaproteobacteria bacterium]|nr:response regulator [Betaproteobacteria bacterium]